MLGRSSRCGQLGPDWVKSQSFKQWHCELLEAEIIFKNSSYFLIVIFHLGSLSIYLAYVGAK